MRVAGVGFRQAATAASLIDAVARAGGGAGLLATAMEKAEAPALREAALRLGLAVRAIGPEDLAAQAVPTRSARVGPRGHLRCACAPRARRRRREASHRATRERSPAMPTRA